jgi:hypothetical protein
MSVIFEVRGIVGIRKSRALCLSAGNCDEHRAKPDRARAALRSGGMEHELPVGSRIKKWRRRALRRSLVFLRHVTTREGYSAPTI